MNDVGAVIDFVRIVGTQLSVVQIEYLIGENGDAPIDTTTTMLVSTMPWESGTTEGVPGHSDGCRGNLTNGKCTLGICRKSMWPQVKS